MRGPGVFVAASILALSARAQDSASTVEMLLKVNCMPCHNDSTKSSGLAMTSRETILAGGNRGVAVKPGNPSESLLLRAVEQSGDLKMPPGRKLPPEQIELVRKWIADGAVWGKDAAGTSKAKGADWWAFQPVKHPEPPAVARMDWVRNPIDQFILARLEKEKLTPSPDASRSTLLRRVSLDLTGLPPSPQEIRDFLPIRGRMLTNG